MSHRPAFLTLSWALVFICGLSVLPAGAQPALTESADECPRALEPAQWSFAQAQQRLDRCNPALRAAIGVLAASRADLVTAGQRPNPGFTAGLGNFNPQAGLGSGPLLDRQIDYFTRIDQPVERGDKRNLRVESAGYALEASRWNAAEVLRQQRRALALAWIDLWGAQQRLALQEELRALMARTRDGAQIRLQAGDLPAADVIRIELDLQRADADRLAAAAALTRARGQVAILLALDPQAGSLRAAEPWSAVMAPQIEAVDVSAPARPDLAAARAQQSQAEAQARLARAQQVRDVSIGLQAERYAPPAGNGWLLGAFVSIPIFLNHRFEGEIARAEADRDLAEASRQRLELSLRAEQQQAVADRLATRARQARLEGEALPLAQRVVANAELAYRKGAGTVLELLDALRQQRALQIDALEARLESDRADVTLRAIAISPIVASDPVFGDLTRWTPTP